MPQVIGQPTAAPPQGSVVDWIHTRPDVVSRLRREPPERVLVLSCGRGEQALAVATAFPNLTVYGVDSDAEAVGVAAATAAASPARDRVVFVRRPGIDPGLPGTFDVVVASGVLTDPHQAGVGVAGLLEMMAGYLTSTGLALLDCPLELTDDTVRAAGFVSVEQVGVSDTGDPAFLLRR